MPDGTIAFCPSGYMEHIPEYQQELLEKNMPLTYKNALIFIKVPLPVRLSL